jgi:hypothetical protein
MYRILILADLGDKLEIAYCDEKVGYTYIMGAGPGYVTYGYDLESVIKFNGEKANLVLIRVVHNARHGLVTFVFEHRKGKPCTTASK